MAEWDTIEGFSYPKGSIYDALNGAGIKWRLYNDNKDAESESPENRGGSIAQVASIKGIRLDLVKSLVDFASDLQGSYPYRYTFIEPNYGNILNGTYEGGSSQHPMDDVYGGESLIKMVYEAIRKSPLWNTSLLIIIYDEHGGFYDSCVPGPTQAPNDVVGHSEYNKYGFDFTQLGVRVPAVVVSPLIPAGAVDHTCYDHASVLATLERLFELAPLTARDDKAADVLGLLTRRTPRIDCPATLVNPAPPTVKVATAPTGVEPSVTDDQPLPTSGNVRGFLAIAAKTDLELSTGTDAEKAAIVQNHHKIKARGHAKTYVTAVMAKVDVARANRA
jgi:phospholipase C